MTIVLFTKENSIYEQLGCECYGKERNALTYTGDKPVIAHPPCRAWGTMKHWAKPEIGEKELALWAFDLVNKNGGILEHPLRSELWKTVNTSTGHLFPINQLDFGHVCTKPTMLYISGLQTLSSLPTIPLTFKQPTHKIQSMKSEFGRKLKWANKNQREGTPEKLAQWMIDIINLIEIYGKKKKSGY
jgi:hypothetical protein